MICTTVRSGHDCTFMKKGGCSFRGGSCHPIVEQCRGCNRIVTHNSASYCASAPEPALKWRSGVCNLATHVKAEAGKAENKINPIKASKRSRR